MPKKLKGVPWSGKPAEAKIHGAKEEAGNPNRKSAQAYRECYASKGFQYWIVARLAGVT
jgi:hypothetical protein